MLGTAAISISTFRRGAPSSPRWQTSWSSRAELKDRIGDQKIDAIVRGPGMIIQASTMWRFGNRPLMQAGRRGSSRSSGSLYGRVKVAAAGVPAGREEHVE